MIRPPQVWHPFVLALYPILLVYTRNADSIYFGETLGPLAAVLLGTLVGWLLLRWRLRDSARAGLIVSAALLAVFSFERNVHAAQVRGWGSTPIAREWLVLGVELASFGGWVWLLRLRKVPIRGLTTMANAGAVALVAFLVPGLVRAAQAPRRFESTAGTQVNPRPDAPAGARPGRAGRPDIYFIVLDAYGRSDVLRELFGWDNREFLERMRRRGFFVADQSTANYCQTALSITATLDGRYHDQPTLAGSKSRLPLRSLIGTTTFGAILRDRGYTLVGCASGFGLTDGFPADRRLAPRLGLAEFDALILDMTPAWTLLGAGAGRASHARHRERINYLFDHLADLAGDPAPTFCLAHVLAPHPPFVFGPRGEDVSGDSSSYRLADGKAWTGLEGHGGPDDYTRRYRDQVVYISARVEAVVDQILDRSPEPPVIIIQGDHGPASHFDPDQAAPNDLLERFGVLNLCLIPGLPAARLAPTMTPINTFRIVSDHLFGTERGVLPNRNYYSSYQAPYRLIDVTPEVAGANAPSGPPEHERPATAEPKPAGQ